MPVRDGLLRKGRLMLALLALAAALGGCFEDIKQGDPGSTDNPCKGATSAAGGRGGGGSALTTPTQVSAGVEHTCALHAGGVTC
jgi:hypothetical protein